MQVLPILMKIGGRFFPAPTQLVPESGAGMDAEKVLDSLAATLRGCLPNPDAKLVTTRETWLHREYRQATRNLLVALGNALVYLLPPGFKLNKCIPSNLLKPRGSCSREKLLQQELLLLTNGQESHRLYRFIWSDDAEKIVRNPDFYLEPTAHYRLTFSGDEGTDVSFRKYYVTTYLLPFVYFCISRLCVILKKITYVLSMCACLVVNPGFPHVSASMSPGLMGRLLAWCSSQVPTKTSYGHYIIRLGQNEVEAIHETFSIQPCTIFHKSIWESFEGIETKAAFGLEERPWSWDLANVLTWHCQGSGVWCCFLYIWPSNSCTCSESWICACPCYWMQGCALGGMGGSWSGLGCRVACGNHGDVVRYVGSWRKPLESNCHFSGCAHWQWAQLFNQEASMAGLAEFNIS